MRVRLTPFFRPGCMYVLQFGSGFRCLLEMCRTMLVFFPKLSAFLKSWKNLGKTNKTKKTKKTKFWGSLCWTSRGYLRRVCQKLVLLVLLVFPTFFHGLKKEESKHLDVKNDLLIFEKLLSIFPLFGSGVRAEGRVSWQWALKISMKRQVCKKQGGGYTFTHIYIYIYIYVYIDILWTIYYILYTI